MFNISALKKRLADTIENSFTRYYLKYPRDHRLERELDQDKELRKIIENLDPSSRGAIIGIIDKIEQESTFYGFKEGFNLAMELLNQKPLFTENE